MLNGRHHLLFFCFLFFFSFFGDQGCSCFSSKASQVKVTTVQQVFLLRLCSPAQNKYTQPPWQEYLFKSKTQRKRLVQTGSCNVFSPAAGCGSPILASPAPAAGGLQGFLVPSLIEPLDVVVASQQTVSRFQFPPQQVQEVSGKVAPPVVDLAHDDVSCTFGGKAEKTVGMFCS